MLYFAKNYVKISGMNAARVYAYAKVNLTLDITGTENGYHTLDSLVTTISLCDRIVAKKRKDGLISVTMRGMGSESIPPETNNAQKAGELFVSRFQTKGADIAVYKNIPIGAGLGGSSADAAGTINALAALYGIKDRAALKETADEVGSDTGFLLEGGFARIRGRGEKIEFLGECPELHFLLICPASGVSSAACYREYDDLAQKSDPTTSFVLARMRAGDWRGAAGAFQNALYPAAARLNRDAEIALEEAKSFSPLGAGMTGSGSAAFALFESAELCEWAKSRYRGSFRAICADAVSPAAYRKAARNPFALGEEEQNLDR